ncbi:LemA family protein [Nannocystis sp.]|uniref:LemA family protein n=1 Tax=Nannocystis sp. TaxID=1962667 RepID=UPI0024251D8C|nr:LemA family protein [Nannocystis sp.]MBK7827143.1 LemA family protein [Nannocystis sp.]MBK9754627.1 LemA family protein [Nannocystis sp.]
MQRRGLIIGAVVVFVLLIGGGTISTYNTLVTLDQEVDSQWAQVENAYQRRADLVPNLVQTVKGAAAHERETLEAVTEARARVGSVTGVGAAADPQVLQRYQAAQDQLSSALTRLVAVSEAYPQLRANENFLALQSQLEGTENRISVERRRFNEAARDFNTRRESFPTVVFAGVLGDRFKAKAYFTAAAGAAEAPKVEF